MEQSYVNDELSSKRMVISNYIRGKISGPISAKFGQRENMEIFLFGDNHLNMDNSCAMPCDTYINGEYKKFNTGCRVIDGLLTEIFEKAADYGWHVYFYLEIPFLPSGPRRMQSRDEIYQSHLIKRYIDKIHYNFFDCFAGRDCPFPNVIFECIDLRNEYKVPDRIIMSDRTIYSYIYDVIVSIINGLKYDVGDYRFPTEKNMDMLAILINNLYDNNFRFLEYFQLGMKSNNFINDVNTLFENLFTQLQYYNIEPEYIEQIRKLLLPSDLIIRREHVNSYIIRDQFISLNKKNIENSIIKFYTDHIQKEDISNFYVERLEDLTSLYYERIRSDENMDLVIVALDNIKVNFKDQQVFQTLFYESYVLDIYTLASMFTGDIENPCIKIVYTGNKHTQLMGQFLEEEMHIPLRTYGLNEISSGYSPSRCLEVDGTESSEL